MNRLDFTERVAIVTGAGGNPGLGRAYAMFLASRGARVVVNDLGLLAVDDASPTQQPAEQVAQEIRNLGGEAISDGHSVADQAGALGIVNSAIQAYGRVDILINNAGVAPSAAFSEVAPDGVELVVATHLLGHIWMCKAAWPHMVDQHYGRIVNITSMIAFRPTPVHPIYAAAKAGIVGLTRALSVQSDADGIRVNALGPSALTLGRPAAPEGLTVDSVSPVAAFLAHEECPFSGQTFMAEGGSMRPIRFFVADGIDHGPGLSTESIYKSQTQLTEGLDGGFID